MLLIMSLRRFSDILVEILAEQQLTVQQAADLCGIHYTMMYGYLSEKATGKYPSMHQILKIATGLKVSPNRLLDWPDGKDKPELARQAGDKLAALPPDHPTRKAIETLLGLESDKDIEEKNDGDKKD